MEQITRARSAAKNRRRDSKGRFARENRPAPTAPLEPEPFKGSNLNSAPPEGKFAGLKRYLGLARETVEPVDPPIPNHSALVLMGLSPTATSTAHGFATGAFGGFWRGRMKLPHLEDDGVRDYMLSEIMSDHQQEVLYLSENLTDEGQKDWLHMLVIAAVRGNQETLRSDLEQLGVIQYGTRRNAAQTLAESEFNRYYIRGMCRAAIAGGYELSVCRVKETENPRPESEERIGMRVSPVELLDDLRRNIGQDTEHGVPGGLNSGLSVEPLQQVSES